MTGPSWKIVRGVGLVLGAGFLLYCLLVLDSTKIFRTLFQVKWWILPVLFNSFGWYLFYTAAWRSYFSNLKTRIPYLHLLKIKICGEAVNLMTPIGFIAGDPVRVLLLQKQLGGSTRLGSVVVDRILHSLAAVTFVLTGLVIASFRASGKFVQYRWALIILYVVIVSFLLFVVLELVRGKGLKVFHPFLTKMGINRRFPVVESQLSLLNDELSSFAGGGVMAFIRAFVFHFMGRILGAMEIALIFIYLVGYPPLILSVILASLTAVVHFVFAFVPGGLGLVESLYGGFFYYHGLDPSLGVSMQLLRRLRALFWIAFGVVLLNMGRKKG